MRDRVIAFLARQLLDVDAGTAAAEADELLAVSERRDYFVEPATQTPDDYYYAMQGRQHHEAAHCESALAAGAVGIEVRMREDGTGWCRYSPVADRLDAIRTHLVGVIAESRIRPHSVDAYAHGGCYDFLRARVLIEEWNQRAVWPPLTCEAAARQAAAFVEARWKQIHALALALGSAGAVDDYEARIFTGRSTSWTDR